MVSGLISGWVRIAPEKMNAGGQASDDHDILDHVFGKRVNHLCENICWRNDHTQWASDVLEVNRVFSNAATSSPA